MLPPQNKFRHFNPRPPWGGRPVRFTNFARIANISIHALRGEGDHTQDFLLSCPQALFQSTPSVGRATKSLYRPYSRQSISIHALRGEGDACRGYYLWIYKNFNPRPPWGGRHYTHVGEKVNEVFQSTPSVGRATINRRACRRYSLNFNPRPPWGGRRDCARLTKETVIISIHALRGEGDLCGISAQGLQKHFNPRPPWGGRRRCQSVFDIPQPFQSTPSVGRATRH